MILTSSTFNNADIFLTQVKPVNKIILWTPKLWPLMTKANCSQVTNCNQCHKNSKLLLDLQKIRLMNMNRKTLRPKFTIRFIQ